MSFTRLRPLILGLALLSTLLLLAACGGEETTTAPTATPAVVAQSGDLEERVGESFNITMGLEQQVLPSFHIEASGINPRWNEDTEQIEDHSWSISADVSGNNVYLKHISVRGDEEPEITEGYIIDGGIGEDGQEFEMVDGELQGSFLLSLTWVTFPLDVVVPLAVASIGTSAQGDEAIDGRAAEKFSVDTANAPVGAMELLSGIFSITSSGGTVWVDKETGALLKTTLDYEERLIYPPGSDTEVGTGAGHVEVLISKVGQVTVELPE